MSNSGNILVTGAAGYIGQLLLPELARQHDVTAVDKYTPEAWQYGQFHQIDIAGEGLLKALSGGQRYDAVIHLAYDYPRAHGNSYRQQRENLDMEQGVYEFALEAGIGRVVVASSNHSADWHESGLLKNSAVLSAEENCFSHNFYGWAHLAGEKLAFVYACGYRGRELPIIHLRLGCPQEHDVAEYANNPQKFKRYLAAYLSPRDLRQLFMRSLGADIDKWRRDDGVPHRVFYGVSDNKRKIWSIESAREHIGFTPEDDSEVVFKKFVDRYL